ncbi:MAG: diguanylate cyclase [Candidatus Omnitrophica bacterium]|nr:diguanylate cyclase [Candidatus Omnitrophota bacterium]
MGKIIYFSDKPTQTIKKILPFEFIKTSHIQKYPSRILIFDYDFLKKRKNIKLPSFLDKIFLIHFSGESQKNLKIIKKYKAFDYFTNSDSKEIIRFKIERLKKLNLLFRRIRSLEKQLYEKNTKVEKITLIDPLTGCFNWRYFLLRARQELNRAHRYFTTISFVAFDIDYFRNINEMYGFKVADAIIKRIIDLIKKDLRKTDILARWREDEIFVILPEQNAYSSYKFALRIKEKINSFTFTNKKIKIKISAGVVSYPDNGITNISETIIALEKCLIEAKKRGGNVVLSYSKLDIGNVTTDIKTSNIEELKEKIHKLNSLLNREILDMIYGFARAIEAKDAYTGKHLESTSLLAESIAKELKLPNMEIEDIKRAAILHDLGKVGIHENILSKRTPLTLAEKKIIKTHPLIAAEILRQIHSLRGSIPAILYHHEHYDGKGYPLGLRGEEIPLGARIVAICDVYHALITDRPYRKAFSKKEALQIIKSEAGKHFDPKIVKVFLKVIKKQRYKQLE